MICNKSDDAGRGLIKLLSVAGSDSRYLNWAIGYFEMPVLFHEDGQVSVPFMKGCVIQ